MSMSAQILLGTILLAVCALIHVAAVAISIPLFSRVFRVVGRLLPILRYAAVLCFGVVVVVIAHTIQIWTWALIFSGVGAFDSFDTSFYFATVTYTTLGYGDLVLGSGLRIFATFASITGLLTFGISTALLIAVVQRLIPAPPGNRT